jgi:chromosome partitioning protein
MELPYTKRGTENRLKFFIQNVTQNVYDFILIDCPPTMSIFTYSAYIASDAILTPVKPDYLSSLGLPLLQRALEEYHEDTGVKPVDLGIVFSMVKENTNVMRTEMQRISSSSGGKYVFKNKLRHGTSIAEAVGKNLPLFKYKKSEKYNDDIFGISEEFLERVEDEF